MNRSVAILGSTGSIGSTALKSMSKKKNYKLILLSAKTDIKKLLKQSITYKCKNAIIQDKENFIKYEKKFKSKGIKLYYGFDSLKSIIKKKISYCINSISGIDGLYPTLKIIPLTKKILIANKESIVCAWHLIHKELTKNNTEFIPLDSEHFSIWKLIKNENYKNIEKVILTASGGPFLNFPKKKILNIKPKFALNHPNWKMGKKISIDSSTMMNKIFEFIEAKKIFNLNKNQLSILIHPSSFVHSIVFFKGHIIKILAHETNMSIPISNALDIYNDYDFKFYNKNIKDLNNLKFQIPNYKQFPLLSILNLLPQKCSYFETILITINDNLVEKYLNKEINYISIHLNLLKLIKSPFLLKYYKLKPKNIYDIKKVINLTKYYIKNKIKFYDR